MVGSLCPPRRHNCSVCRGAVIYDAVRRSPGSPCRPGRLHLAATLTSQTGALVPSGPLLGVMLKC